MAETESSPPTTTESALKRPEKPDDAKFKADLEQATKHHEAMQKKFDAAREKLDAARSGKDSSGNDEFKQLLDEQKEIRNKQASSKSSRTTQQEKHNKNEQIIKDLIKKQNEQRSSIGYKSVEEIDKEIDHLNKQVDSGSMKIVDEKKALQQATNLGRLKKQFAGLEDAQKIIDQKKAENVELKKTFDSAESRQLSQKYETNQKRLDEIKASREGKNKSFDVLKAEREKAFLDQKAAYAKSRQIKDDYYQNKKAYKEYEDTLYQQRRERQKAERDSYEKEKRRRIADEKLGEADQPAFQDEIRSAEGLIVYFKPGEIVSNGAKGPRELAAVAQRTVDEAKYQGMKVMKKEDEDFFVGSGGKKKGKGKKGAAVADGASAPTAGKFQMNIGIIEELGKLGVEPPSTQADVAGVVEKLKEKVSWWKDNAESERQKNVEQAKKEIERLEKEASETPASEPAPKGRRQERSKKVAQQNAGANSDIPAENELSQENDAAADVTKDLKDASIEDQETEATA